MIAHEFMLIFLVRNRKLNLIYAEGTTDGPIENKDVPLSTEKWGRISQDEILFQITVYLCWLQLL